MDEERMPYELTKKIFWAMIIIIIQAVLFSYFKTSGIFFLLGILAIMFVFNSRDKNIKKQNENNFLKQNDWYVSKHKLTKNIP